MKEVVTRGVILSRINYQEADRILTFLTADGTKILVMAKGVRKPKSKLAGSVELFSVCQITYLPGKSSMGTLISARLTKHYGRIVKSLERTQLAYELLRFLNKYTEEVSTTELYDMLVEAFESLDDPSIPEDLVRSWFGIKFLGHMGHSPNLHLELAKISAQNFRFDIDKMQFVPDPDGIYSPNEIKLLRLLESHYPAKVSNVTGLDKLLPKVVKLVQLLMVANGFGFN